MTTWLGEAMTPTDPDAGYAEIVRRLLWTFGPVTRGRPRVVARCDEGCGPRRAGRPSRRWRSQLDSGSTGWVLPDDTADLEAPAVLEPWVALLPTLDPTTMGWREREFHLDPAHTPFLFDRAGNGGTDGLGRRPDRRVLGAGRARAGPARSSWRRCRRTPAGCSTSRRPASTSSSGASTSPTCSPPPR